MSNSAPALARCAYSWLDGAITATPVMPNGSAVPFYADNGEAWLDYAVFDSFNNFTAYVHGEFEAQLLGNALAVQVELQKAN